MRFTGYRALILGALAIFFAPSIAAGQSAPLPNVTVAHGGPVLMGTEPNTLVMGRDWISSVEAVLPEGARVVGLFVAQGELRNIEFPSKTRVRARYVAPKTYVPMVDVIALLADIDGKEQWSYCTIVLYGQGEATVETLRGAEAVITIGDRVFGPVVADKRGQASIRVEVPPGVQFGYDAHGRPIDLHIPKVPRTAVFASNEEIRIGRKKPVSLFVVVVNPDGSINENSIPTIIADRGLVRDLRHMGRGAFEARFHPPVAGEGLIRVEAFISREEYPPSVLNINLVSEFQTKTDEAEQESEFVTEPSGTIPIYWSSKLGYAWEPPSTSGFHVGTDLGLLFRLFGEQFLIGLGFGFSTSSTENLIAHTSGNIEASMNTWVYPIVLELGWKRTLNPRAELVLCGQFGMARIVNTAGAVVDGDDVLLRDKGLQGLVGLGLGVEWPAGPGNILTAVRYVWYPGKFERFDGVFSAFFLDLGYRFWFE